MQRLFAGFLQQKRSVADGGELPGRAIAEQSKNDVESRNLPHFPYTNFTGTLHIFAAVPSEKTSNKEKEK